MSPATLLTVLQHRHEDSVLWDFLRGFGCGKSCRMQAISQMRTAVHVLVYIVFGFLCRPFVTYHVVIDLCWNCSSVYYWVAHHGVRAWSKTSRFYFPFFFLLVR